MVQVQSWGAPALALLVLLTGTSCGGRAVDADAGAAESDGAPVADDEILFECWEEGTVAPKFWICDGWPDCAEERDEDEDLCSDPPLFECNDGELVPWPDLCKSDRQGCADGTDDEAFCHQFDRWYFACDLAWFSDDPTEVPRIPVSWVCDGSADCRGHGFWEGFDEEGYGCSLGAAWSCDNGDKIGYGAVCNGFENCSDGSDEPEDWCERWAKGPDKPEIEY